MTCGFLSRLDEILILISNTQRSPRAVDFRPPKLVNIQPLTRLLWDITPNPQSIPHILEDFPTTAPFALLPSRVHHKRFGCRLDCICSLRKRARLDHLSVLVLRSRYDYLLSPIDGGIRKRGRDRQSVVSFCKEQWCFFWLQTKLVIVRAKTLGCKTNQQTSRQRYMS